MIPTYAHAPVPSPMYHYFIPSHASVDQGSLAFSMDYETSIGAPFMWCCSSLDRRCPTLQHSRPGSSFTHGAVLAPQTSARILEWDFVPWPDSE